MTGRFKIAEKRKAARAPFPEKCLLASLMAKKQEIITRVLS